MKKVYCKCGEIIRIQDVPPEGKIICPSCHKRLLIRRSPDEVLFADEGWPPVALPVTTSATPPSATVISSKPHNLSNVPTVRLEILKKPRNALMLSMRWRGLIPKLTSGRFLIAAAAFSILLVAYVMLTANKKFALQDILPRAIVSKGDEAECRIEASRAGMSVVRLRDCLYHEESIGYMKFFPGKGYILLAVEGTEGFPVLFIDHPGSRVPKTLLTFLLEDCIVAQLKPASGEPIELVIVGVGDPDLDGERMGDWNHISDPDALAEFMLNAYDDVQKFKRR
ncbi:MAG: hypothetical protein O3A29_05985 [Planctomycetota bacterium]|nr:hypothetical protein [Planctomycetota bacterium]